MKKLLSVLLTVAIVATLCSVLCLSASASKTVDLCRLTATSTDLKLTNDNMSEADAITACTEKLGNELATTVIYAKTADGKYKYICCYVNTGWISGGTETLDKIIANAGIYGVLFLGTVTDKCEPVDYMTEVKAAGAAATTFNFGTNDFHICTEEELPYVQNEVNREYKGVGNVVCIELYLNKQYNQVMAMEFRKPDANKDCVAVGIYGECKTFADYVTQNASYVDTAAKYVVGDVLFDEMLDGKDQSIDLKKANSATFRSDADFDEFIGLMIDGKFVDKKYFNAKAGSTIVEVKKAYLNTLSNDKHTLSIVSETGFATTEFTLSGATGTAIESAKTGDNSNVALFVVLMAVSAIGVAAILYREKKAVR